MSDDLSPKASHDAFTEATEGGYGTLIDEVQARTAAIGRWVSKMERILTAVKEESGIAAMVQHGLSIVLGCEKQRQERFDYDVDMIESGMGSEEPPEVRQAADTRRTAHLEVMQELTENIQEAALIWITVNTRELSNQAFEEIMGPLQRNRMGLASELSKLLNTLIQKERERRDLKPFVSGQKWLALVRVIVDRKRAGPTRRCVALDLAVEEMQRGNTAFTGIDTPGLTGIISLLKRYLETYGSQGDEINGVQIEELLVHFETRKIMPVEP